MCTSHFNGHLGGGGCLHRGFLPGRCLPRWGYTPGPKGEVKCNLARKKFSKQVQKSYLITRMHSSRMCTTHFNGHLGGDAGLSLTLIYSSTNMSKSVWTSGFWKPLVHQNMSNFWNNIFHKFSIPKSNFGR